MENLFDDRTAGTEYPEFRGVRWNRELYPLKLAAVGRVIRRSCRGGPDVVLLQEVESEEALLALRDRALRGLGYRHAVFARDAAVPRLAGEAAAAPVTSVGLLSRLPVRVSRQYDSGTFEALPLRPILEVELEVQGRRLTVFNSHWKSKVGGVEATEAGRRQSSGVLAERLRAVLAADPAAEVLVAGDLNLDLQELAAAGWPLSPVADPRGAGLGPEAVLLYDPWYELPAGERGSAAYGGRWQTPDHFLLAPGLLDGDGLSYRAGGFRVVRRRFLVQAGSGFPRRFDPAAASRGDPGYSDHLPLLLEIVLQR